MRLAKVNVEIDALSLIRKLVLIVAYGCPLDLQIDAMSRMNNLQSTETRKGLLLELMHCPLLESLVLRVAYGCLQNVAFFLWGGLAILALMKDI
ncbi:hypothetical protein COLO4_32619 [Corchorus olitorius]|uniref:Uncharacterized protein n=1 Tax=Corchorus olitorius TaxID=93759 RepID=A0A1R3GZ23_9ROSI|nr:hypothetical protein COLO4_32619 [Corchorus olitorius]